MQGLKRTSLSFFTISIFFIQNILRAEEQSTLEIVQDYVATQRLPGVIFSETTPQKTSHMTDGRRNIHYQEAIQKDELFPIASLSKIFTSILILQEIEIGKLSFHSKLKDIFHVRVHEDYEDLDVEEIMYHRGGFPMNEIDSTDLENHSKTRSDLTRFFLRHGPYHSLKNSNYSTYGFVVLGAILEHLENKSWEQIVTERLLKPLKLHSCRLPYDPSIASFPKSSKIPLLTDDDYKNMLFGHLKQNRKIDWISGPIKENAHSPFDNPGAGLFCKIHDIHKFIKEQLSGYKIYLDSLEGKENNLTQKIFQNISTYKYLFHSPQQNMQSISHWVLFSQQFNPQKVFAACAYGSSGGTSIVTCFDLKQNKIASAFANAWSDRVFDELREILDTTFHNKLLLKKLNPYLLPLHSPSFMNSASKFSSERN